MREGMMRSFRVLIVAIIVSIGAASPSCAGPQEDVAERIAAWTNAFASGDGKAIVGVYAAEARLWGTLAKAQDIGGEAIGRYFDNVFAALSVRKILIGEHAIRVYGDAAVASGSMELQFTRKDGTSGALPVRFSMAFVKSGTTWWIVDHHSSPLQK
jgi:hypothetical protein